IFFLQLYCNTYISRFKIFLITYIISIIFLFYVVIGIVSNLFYKPTLPVYNRNILSVFIFNHDGRNVVFFTYTKVICTKSRRGMYNSSSIFRTYKIAMDNSKGI